MHMANVQQGAVPETVYLINDRVLSMSSAPTVAERNACYAARDVFYACLVQHSDDENKCMQEKGAYHNSCLRSWVNRHVSITMAVRLNCTLSCMQYLNIIARGTIQYSGPLWGHHSYEVTVFPNVLQKED